MNGLNQVKAALVERLRGAGIRAVGGYGDKKAAAYPDAVAVVEVAKATGTAMGLGNYLGTAQVGGVVRELYGQKMDVSISVDIYAPGGAEACEAAMERAAEALMSGLPSGLRLGEISWGETRWDKAEQRYVRRGTLCCTACFTATVEQETGILLDFILKGVMRSAQHGT